MRKYFALPAFLMLLFSCNQPVVNKAPENKDSYHNETRMYSKAVGDSFSIFVNLPENYDPGKKDTYPVVYLLDANLYFDIMATTIDRYAEVGLLPTVILVGIGYTDFPMMDSLRSRDDTYPVAIPEYEMSVSGGGNKFLSFMGEELVPYIDSAYKTNTAKRVLMGHSLGGYFTMYALQQQLSGKATAFNNYIAASPSLHYNNYYLLKKFSETAHPGEGNKKIKAYITYGGLEEADAGTDTTIIKLAELTDKLSVLLAKKQPGMVLYKSDIFSNLGHMDTQLPTFIKGLQWTLGEVQ